MPSQRLYTEAQIHRIVREVIDSRLRMPIRERIEQAINKEQEATVVCCSDYTEYMTKHYPQLDALRWPGTD